MLLWHAAEVCALSSCHQPSPRLPSQHRAPLCPSTATAPQWVFGWRLQAEQRMRSEGKAGMTDEQIADFVSRYIPAYTAYLPSLYAQGPTTAQAGRSLIIQVDQKRSPMAQQPAPVA